MNRRKFIKRYVRAGAAGLFLPTIFVPKLTAQSYLPNRRSAWRKHTAAAGGAGPFTFIASAIGYIAAAGSTTVNTTALNVAAGDLLVVFTSWQDAETGNTIVVDESDGTDVFTSGAVVVNANDTGACFSHLLNAPADASFAVRVTTQACRRLEPTVMQFRPTTAPAAVDAVTTPATGSSAAPASNTLSTTVAAGLVVGGAVSASGTVPTVEQIGGVAATGSVDGGGAWGSMWYRITTTTLSNIAATCTAGNDLWVAGENAYK